MVGAVGVGAPGGAGSRLTVADSTRTATSSAIKTSKITRLNVGRSVTAHSSCGSNYTRVRVSE